MGEWAFDTLWGALNHGIGLVPFEWRLAILGGLAVLLWIVGGNRALMAFGAGLMFFLGFKTGRGTRPESPPPAEPERPKRRTLRDIFRR